MAKPVAQQMDHAGLYDRVIPHRADSPRKPLKPIADHHAQVGDAAVFDLGQHRQPELGPPAAAGPQPEDVALAGAGHPYRDVDGAVGDLAIADHHEHASMNVTGGTMRTHQARIAKGCVNT